MKFEIKSVNAFRVEIQEVLGFSREIFYEGTDLQAAEKCESILYMIHDILHEVKPENDIKVMHYREVWQVLDNHGHLD
jgi:hypothetical protein